MLNLRFTNGTNLKFDPIHVKLYTENNEPLKFNLENNVKETCSKFVNQVLQHRHKNTQFKDPRNIRILLGHACNFRCKYCQQKHTAKELITDEEINNLQKLIIDNLDLSILETVQYWGGEPLLYWNEIKKFRSFFKKVAPRAGTCIITNGSLMNEDIYNEIKNDNNFSIILSHDGPGQYLRGPDPLDDKSTSKKYLLSLCKIKNTDPNFRNNYDQNFAVNPVLTKETINLKELIKYYDNVFGQKVAIAESIPVIPTNPEAAKYAYDLNKLNEYSEMLFQNLKELGFVQFNNFKTQFDLFTSKLQSEDFEIGPTKAQCFTTDPRMLVIDIHGNILPCQTFQAHETLENGDSCNCGNISNMNDIHMPTVHGIGSRTKCQNCLVASFCMGACPYLVNKNTHDIDCQYKYAHFYGLLKYFLYILTNLEIQSVEK